MSQGGQPDRSVASELKRSVAKAYVREMLDLNPMFQSPEIIRRRREIWNVGDPGQTSSPVGGNALGRDQSDTGQNATNATLTAAVFDPQVEQEFRARAKMCLEKLRAKFFELTDETLHKYLRIISNDRVPELSATASRLRAVAGQRETLLKAVEETGDVKFAYSLQFAMIGTAAQAGALREQYIESLITDRRVAAGAEVVKKYVALHPDIYQLDRDWFNALLDPSNHRDWSSNYSTLSSTRRFFARPRLSSVAAVILIAFSVISGIVRRASKYDFNSKPETPAWQPPPGSLPGGKTIEELLQPKDPDTSNQAGFGLGADKPSDSRLNPFPESPQPNSFPNGMQLPLTAPIPRPPEVAPPRSTNTPNEPVLVPEQFEQLFPGIEQLLPPNSPGAQPNPFFGGGSGS